MSGSSSWPSLKRPLGLLLGLRRGCLLALGEVADGLLLGRVGLALLALAEALLGLLGLGGTVVLIAMARRTQDAGVLRANNAGNRPVNAGY